ncbi:phosphatidate cytidylyltransferase, partial [Thalassiosira pseudonana CCMP1335]
LYLSLGFHYLLQICSAGGPIHIGNLLFIVWMSDTGALIFGRMSKEKQSTSLGAFLSFLKSISPGKTLPGLVGALITVCIDDSSTSTAINQLMHNPIVQKMILGLLLSLSGITGDLAESSVKRISKKKNSGGLLPGHGGVVDRFDSLF